MPKGKCGFQKGNQLKKGYPFGSPRYVAPTEEEMIKLGTEMLEWIEKNEPLHLADWYTVEKMITYNEWKTYIQRREFIPFYEKALRLVSKHYINGTIHPSLAQRFLRIYNKDLKDEEDDTLLYKLEKEIEKKKELMAYEQKLRMDAAQQVDPETLDKFKAIMQAMGNTQKD